MECNTEVATETKTMVCAILRTFKTSLMPINQEICLHFEDFLYLLNSNDIFLHAQQTKLTRRCR